MNEITFIEISKLYPHPENPRKDLGELTELADSIKAKGIMQNLTVVPGHDGSSDGYTVVIGHRRLAAAKLAGRDKLPCIVTEMTEKEQLSTMLLENIQRADLTPYEQAQGFQMMIDLGETVESISKESGFSTATVRRRVKMAELDQDILKEVSDRQITLADFDRLAKVEDIDARNEILKEIGTSNFNYALRNKIRRQEVDKALEVLPKEIKRLHAKKMKSMDIYSPSFYCIAEYDLEEWDKTTPLSPKSNGKQLYYWADSCDVSFYIEAEKAKEPEKTETEKGNARKLGEVWARVDDIQKTARYLRHEFVKNLTVTQKNRDAMLRGAILTCILQATTYIPTDKDMLFEEFGLKNTHDTEEDFKQVYKVFNTEPNKISPMAIYTTLGDSDGYGLMAYVYGSRNNWPNYQKSTKYDILYDWLISLGYEMSDDEKALRDGTHEIFTSQLIEE